MTDAAKLVSSEEAVLVFGSLNAKEEDRYHGRESIEPVQVIVDGEVRRVTYFNDWGEFGVSSMSMAGGPQPELYITTGSDLARLRLNGGVEIDRFDIPCLQDVHEISFIDGMLWLANTGYDEAVSFDPREAKVSRRIKLQQFRLKAKVAERAEDQDPQSFQEVDRFHCNQVFKGMDGRLYALVHHATGRQLIARIANKFIKKQGNGGVVDLESGHSVQLRLKGPHSVRNVGGEYWVFDSGNMTMNVYDDRWKLLKRIPTAGWGRGADQSGDGKLFYAGISEKRRRYQERDDDAGGNMVQIFRVADGHCVGKVPIISGIEQVNNVYVIPRTTALALLAL